MLHCVKVLYHKIADNYLIRGFYTSSQSNAIWSECFVLKCCLRVHQFHEYILFTVDIDAVCQMNKTAIVANPFNCAQYYDCSKQVSAFGKPYLQECKYPDLFSSGTNSCEPFTSVTGSCGRRKEAQAPCKTLYLFSYLPSGIIWNAIIYIYRNIYYIYQ